jgi:hypothetical protein
VAPDEDLAAPFVDAAGDRDAVDVGRGLVEAGVDLRQRVAHGARELLEEVA